MAAAAVAGAVTGCSATAGGGHPSASATRSSLLPPVPTAPGATAFSDAPLAAYKAAVTAALAHHLHVWIETDLVKRWLEGPVSFLDAVSRVALLANRPGVVGIKIADELGYHDGLGSPAAIRQFLVGAAAALRRAAPGKSILVDMVVPQLGCAPGGQVAGLGPTSCATAARASYPQLALDQVDSYLRLRAIDVLDLSTGILTDADYATWRITQATAERLAWAEVGRRGWGRLVRLQARKALAHPGRFSGTPAQAVSDVHTFVDTPLAGGARAVDIWTWHQEYSGAIYRLMDPGLRPNALWDQLKLRRPQDEFFTHMSPHSVESGLNTDLAVIATVFTDIFLPAGTG